MNTKKKSKAGLKSFDAFLDARLKNHKFAVAYLKAALEDGSQADFQRAISQVIRAQGNVSKVAEEAGISRQIVHKMLSGRGDLSFASLTRLLGALGGRFDVAFKSHKAAA